MKRRIFLVLFFLILPVCFCIPALASETDFEKELMRRSGAAELYASLDNDTQDLLSAAGIEGPVWKSEDENLLKVFTELFREKLSAPVTALGALMAVVILCKLGSSFEPGETGGLISLATAVACGAVAVTPLLELMRTTRQAVETTGGFLLAAVPVYAALMIASGNAAAGGTYSIFTLAAGNAIPLIASMIIFPTLHVLLALALINSVSELHMERLASTVYGAAKWLLVLVVSVFSGILSVQTALSAQLDAAGGKAAKLMVSAAIPIVGSALGDAVQAIKGSVDLLKSGVGAFGILAALCILAPTAIEAALWIAVCSAGQILGDLFNVPKISAFLGACGNVAKMLLAVIVSTGVVAVVTAALLLFVKGSL